MNEKRKVIMKFLGTHRGAALYKVLQGDEDLYSEFIEEQVRAEAVHPGQGNLKADFKAKGKIKKRPLRT